MNDERRHCGTMDTIRHRRAGFQPELVINNNMAAEESMRGDGDAIEQCENGIGEAASVRATFRSGRIRQLDRRCDALRPDVHHRLQSGNTLWRTLDDLAHKARWELSEKGVIGDISDAAARQDPATAFDDGGADVLLLVERDPIIGAEDQFDFQLHQLVVSPLVELLGEDIAISGLNPVKRSPRPEIAKECENVSPRRLALDELVKLPPPPQRFEAPESLNVRHHQVSDGRLVIVVDPEFFFIDEFESRDSLNRGGERPDRPANLENQQALRCQRGWVRPQL
jgi:hypothetical protein